MASLVSTVAKHADDSLCIVGIERNDMHCNERCTCVLRLRYNNGKQPSHRMKDSRSKIVLIDYFCYPSVSHATPLSMSSIRTNKVLELNQRTCVIPKTRLAGTGWAGSEPAVKAA